MRSAASGIATAWLLLAAAGPATSAEPAPSHPCATRTDAEARLACYDTAFPVTAEVRQSEAERPIRMFGASRQRADGPGDDTLDRIEADVVRVNAGPSGARVFVLDNGQMWAQSDARPHGRVVTGDRVEIRRGPMGNHVLRTPARVPIAVRRTR